MEAEGAAAGQAPGPTRALDWIELLATQLGPRRPCSEAEREAASLIAAELGESGIAAELEPFRGYSTFALPIGVILALAITPELFPQSRRLLRSLLGAGAVAGLVSEGGLVHTPLSDALSRQSSQNLVATIEPSGEVERTVALVCHLDTSRSGLMFHPALVANLNRWIAVQSFATLLSGLEPILGTRQPGRRILRAARALDAIAALLLLEREVRGEDVPGANDNASGAAVVAELALECRADPLEGTRLVVLMTGCEESGLLGMQSFLRSHDTSGWLFLNFDSVGGGTLRYAVREGIVQKWESDSRLVELAGRIAVERPEIGLAAAKGPIGLTYDATAVLARGGRALTFVAGDGGVIPNYHWPTDTAPNIDPDAIVRAIEVGRAMVAAVDRGEAD